MKLLLDEMSNWWNDKLMKQPSANDKGWSNQRTNNEDIERGDKGQT